MSVMTTMYQIINKVCHVKHETNMSTPILGHRNKFSINFCGILVYVPNYLVHILHRVHNSRTKHMGHRIKNGLEDNFCQNYIKLYKM